MRVFLILLVALILTNPLSAQSTTPSIPPTAITNSATTTSNGVTITGQNSGTNTPSLVSQGTGNTNYFIDTQRRQINGFSSSGGVVVNTRAVNAKINMPQALTAAYNVTYTTNSNFSQYYTNNYSYPSTTSSYTQDGTNYTYYYSGYTYVDITTPPPLISNITYNSTETYTSVDQYGNTNYSYTYPGSTNLNVVNNAATTNTSTSSFYGYTNTSIYYYNSYGTDYYQYVYGSSDGYLPATVSADVDDNGIVYSAEVKVVVQTTWDLDGISIVLTDPEGNTYSLLRPFYRGTSGFATTSSASYTHSLNFKSNAKQTIYSVGKIPIFGSFIPDSSLLALNVPAKGTWSVTVQAGFGSYTANLVSVNIKLNVIDNTSNGFRF